MFPHEEGESHFSKWGRKSQERIEGGMMWMIFGEVAFKVLEVASPFSFIQLIPTSQPTHCHLSKPSASLRRCDPPPLFSVCYLSRHSLFIWGGGNLYGTYAPVSCNRLLILLNKIKRLWRHTCVGHQCVVISYATWGLVVSISCYMICCSNWSLKD